ncbi:MAG TPA: cytochrome c maturation protein CcmE [Thermoanaerobaculia bacterium]|nr:cytochrome c maturation protein CcmE [Thermoanaerobaculia bacterium]
MTFMKPELSASDLMRRKTRRFVFLAFAVAAIAFLAIAAGGINHNLVYYWTPTDLRAAGNKAYGATIRLGGMVAGGSIRHRTGTTGVEFDVKDTGAIVHVKSTGVPPQMFRDNIGVVVEGTMTRGGSFESHRLMVSHNNQYKAPQAGHPVDPKQMKKYIEEAQ